ncbi:TPA: hypothetical protein ACKR15_005358 [Pseudomonas aeruginosa]
MAARRIAFILLFDTPQRDFTCGAFLWLAVTLILSFCSTFLLKAVFDQH